MDASPSRGSDLFPEVAPVLLVREDLAGEHQGDPCLPGRVHGLVIRLLGADPAHREGEPVLARARPQDREVDPVGHRRQQGNPRRAVALLGCRDAVHPRPGPAREQRLRGIEVNRQVERREGRRAVRRQIRGEVHAVEVEKVHRVALQRLGDRPPDVDVPLGLSLLVEGVRGGDRQQRPLARRTLAGDDDRPVPGLDQRVIQSRQDLFRSTHRVRTDRRERVRNSNNQHRATTCK